MGGGRRAGVRGVLARSAVLLVLPRSAVLLMLALSAVLLMLAPAAVPDDYSWVAHTLSEAAAQGVPGAWVARLGLALFGAGVLALSWWSPSWGLAGRVLHGVFGLALVASAVFPTRSWVEGAAYDPMLDAAHSVAATGMGFAFALGVVSVAVTRRRVQVLDVAVVAASVGLPLGMLAAPGAAGVLQRAMFALAYAWYGLETRGAAGSGASRPSVAD